MLLYDYGRSEDVQSSAPRGFAALEKLVSFLNQKTRTTMGQT